MELHLGLASIDVKHSRGSLLAEIEGLRSCFGLTTPEFDDLRAKAPAIDAATVDGYVPLAVFLSAMGENLKERLDGLGLSMSVPELREMEIRWHTQILLVGVLARDLLGGIEAAPGTELAATVTAPKDPHPRVAPMPSEKQMRSRFDSISTLLDDMCALRNCLREDMENADFTTPLSRETCLMATNFYDGCQTLAWNVTSWYGPFFGGRVPQPEPVPDPTDAMGDASAKTGSNEAGGKDVSGESEGAEDRTGAGGTARHRVVHVTIHTGAQDGKPGATTGRGAGGSAKASPRKTGTGRAAGKAGTTRSREDSSPGAANASPETTDDGANGSDTPGGGDRHADKS